MELGHVLLLDHLEFKLALGRLLLHAGLRSVFFSAKTLHPFRFFGLDFGSTLGIFFLEFLTVKFFVFVEFGTARVFLCNSLLACLFLESECFLSIVLLLSETALAFELSLLPVQPFLLKLCRPFFFSSLGRHSPTFSIFLFKAESFIFFLFLSKAILAIELLLSESELLSVSLGLEFLTFLKFAFVQLSQVSRNFGLLVLGFALQTQLLFFESLFTGSFFSFVFGSIGFVHCREFLLTSGFVFLSLFLGISFLLGQTFPGSFELSHALQFFLLLQFSEAFFLDVCLIASNLFCGFCLLTQAFSLSKLGAALSLGSFLLLSLFLNLDPKLFLFLLLLFDNCKIVIMVFVFFSN